MNELERRLRATVQYDSTAASDARAPRDVRRAIARRRAVSAGSAGVVAAVFLGSVAIGGLGLTQAPEPSPSPTPTPDLSIDQGPRAYATIPLPATSHITREVSSFGESFCGEPTPEPVTHSGDFTASFETPESLDLSRGVYASPNNESRSTLSLTHNGADELPAFAGGIAALLVDEGVVVGYTREYSEERMNTFVADQTSTHLWDWDSWFWSCAAAPDNPIPPEGEYDVVLVSRVHNNLDKAAQWGLELDGHVIPSAADVEAFREGSFYCDDALRWHYLVPLTCNPAAVVGFEIDQDAGTATVPYDTSLYTRDVDLTFVSPPVPARLTGEIDEEFFEPAGSTYESGTTPICGDFFQYVPGNEASLAAMWPMTSTLPAAGDQLPATVWVWSFGWSSAEVALPSEFRIWVAQTKEESEEAVDGDTTYTTTFFGTEVVGWLDVEVPNRSPVELSIYDGPADWPLTVTDAHFCEGYETPPANGSRATYGLSGLVAAPVKVTMGDGSVYEELSFTIDPSLHE